MFVGSYLEDCIKSLELTAKTANSYATVGLGPQRVIEVFRRGISEIKPKDKEEVVKMITEYIEKLDEIIKVDQEGEKKVKAIGICGINLKGKEEDADLEH
jgi:Tat protein secretion system quality control protein TatD with DNase activity